MTGPDAVFFWVAFWCYLVATVGASLYAGLRREGLRRLVFALTAAGFASNTVALAVRTAGSGHLPITHLYEYLTFFAWAIVVAFLLAWRRLEHLCDNAAHFRSPKGGLYGRIRARLQRLP